MSVNMVPRVFRFKEFTKLISRNPTHLHAEKAFINSLIISRSYYSKAIQDYLSKQLQFRKQYTHRFYSVKTADQSAIDDYRNEHKISIIGHDIPPPFTDIENNEFPEYIKTILKNQGITKPTVIQSQGWPIALSGQNFVGIAQTGTGKTLAYLLPAVVHIKENVGKKGLGPRVLVLAPTRELARQIEEVAKTFKNSLNIRCACIYGGASRGKQAAELKAGVDIVIATPGRLNDFLDSQTTTLNRCTYVVLDEADRMLDMGFEPQIRQALEGVPLERQILMFSATWPKEVKHLAKDYLGEFVQVNVGSTELTANHNITQNIHICDQEEKMEKFKSIMHEVAGDGFGKVLVFTNTKKFVDTLTFMLRKNGWKADGIHGDKSQMQRDMTINKFKTGRCNILVATDVAARGLDVDGVSHVINYDYPNTSEDYIHRIGRTGRQDNKGVAHTILTDENARQAKGLIAVLKEAKQEVSEELIDFARSFDITKMKDNQQKRRPRQQWDYNPNKRWNKFQSSRYY